MMRKQPANMIAAALEALPTAVLLVDSTGNVRARNKVAGEMLSAGKTLADVLKCDDGDGVAPDWSADLVRIIERHEPVRYKALRLAGEDGLVHLADVQLVHLSGQDGTVLVVAEDVTARESMERRLATSERLAAVGTLAAQVAHELNNPLDGVMRHLGLAERSCGGEGADQLRRCLVRAREGVARMAEIVANLLDTSRTAGRAVEAMPLNSLIDQAVEAMSPSMEAAGVAVICDLGDGSARPVPGTLFQVACNLMKNAADAMPSGGRLVITCRCGRGEAEITFADVGDGIPQALIGRIFEPFFSTKPGSKGTGLGLSICRDIVEQAGGTIEPANRPGGGAVFTVKVPLGGAKQLGAGGGSGEPR